MVNSIGAGFSDAGNHNPGLLANAGGAITITFEAAVSQTIGSIVNTAVISGGGEMITRTATVAVKQRLYLPVVLKKW